MIGQWHGAIHREKKKISPGRGDWVGKDPKGQAADGIIRRGFRRSPLSSVALLVHGPRGGAVIVLSGSQL